MSCECSEPSSSPVHWWNKKRLITFDFLLFLPGSTQWYHGPVQWIWVVSIQHRLLVFIYHFFFFLQLNRWKNECESTNKHQMLPLQQHGRLWEDRDIGGQRQSGDGEHQTGVLRATASPGERRLWKGTCGSWERALHTLDHIPSIMWCTELFRLSFLRLRTWLFLNIWIIFSSVQVFQVKKVVGAAAGKIFAMKVLKKVLFIFHIRHHETQSCFYHFNFEWCTAALSQYPVDIMIARLLLQINIMVPLSANIGCPWSRRWGKISLLVGRLPSLAAAALAHKTLCLSPLDSAWCSRCFCSIG